MIQMRDAKTFFKYVFPSILSFALSGVYAIVDGFFVGNRLGDIGLSAVNIAYPIVAFIQAVGTGLGMGGAIYYWFYIAFQRCLSTAKKAVFSMGLKASRRDICGLLFAFVQGAVFGSIFFLGK